MEIIRIPNILRDTCRSHFQKGKSIGLVPTMGALHEGHLSLAKRCRAENDISVVSIFVNPIQFGPSEDFQRYPRDLEADIEKLGGLGADILFLPDQGIMYKKGHATFVSVEYLSERLCGAFRPGHFRGVATVVAKLFNLTNPARAYFGQKDYQQTVIIRKMAEDLNFAVDVVVCPTVREADGLAKSSRNLYLGKEERMAATVLYRSLGAAEAAMKSGMSSPPAIRNIMEEMLRQEPLVTSVEYASVLDPLTLQEPAEAQGEVLLAVAVRIGETRLIDNMLVSC